jgi:hypothetical protein
MRTGEQLRELKSATMALIREIERCDSFPPRESALCPWCDYQRICPVRKHRVALAALPPGEFRADRGVELVDGYVAAVRERKLLDDKISGLRDRIVDYCNRNGMSAVEGSRHHMRVTERDRPVFPSRAKEPDRYAALRALLESNARWAEVSEISERLLNAAIENGRWEDGFVEEVKRYRRLVKSVTVRLAARDENG